MSDKKFGLITLSQTTSDDFTKFAIQVKKPVEQFMTTAAKVGGKTL